RVPHRPREFAQSAQRIADENRARIITDTVERPFLDDRGRGTVLERLRHEVMAVASAAANRDEEISRRYAPRIEGDSPEALRNLHPNFSSTCCLERLLQGYAHL